MLCDGVFVDDRLQREESVRRKFKRSSKKKDDETSKLQGMLNIFFLNICYFLFAFLAFIIFYIIILGKYSESVLVKTHLVSETNPEVLLPESTRKKLIRKGFYKTVSWYCSSMDSSSTIVEKVKR